jgi:hypothetical protein
LRARAARRGVLAAAALVLAMGACPEGPAPVGVSAAAAQQGTSQGAWRRLPPPASLFGNGAIGIERSSGRVHLLGRGRPENELWTYDRTLGDRPWSVRPIEGSMPDVVGTFHYDAVGNRFLMIGYDFTFSDTLPPEANLEIWSVPTAGTPRWIRLDIPGVSPGPRRGSSVAIDGPGRRLYLLGGQEVRVECCERVLGDLWELRLDPPLAWTRLTPAGPDLPGGGEGTMFYEAERQRLTVVGRIDTLALGTFSRRVQSIDLAGSRTWFESPHSDTSQASEFGYACHVPERGELVFLRDRGFQEPQDSTYLRILDLAGGGGWSRRDLAPGPAPDVASYLQLLFDPAAGRMVLVGGRGIQDQAQHADLWSFPADEARPAWSLDYSSMDEGRLDLTGPMALDEGRRRVHALSRFVPGDVQTYRLDEPGGWELLRYNGPGGTAREGAVAVFDPGWSRLICFGGGLANVELGDLWECALGGATARWRRHLPTGETPLPRTRASAVLDPIRRRMVLFGGYAGRPLDDVWQLDLRDSIPRWARVETRGIPPAGRWGQSAIYDPRRDAMVVFGGASGEPGQPSPLRDVHVLSFVDGDTWIPLDPAGNAPLGRYRHAALYDPVGDRVIVLWGRDASGGRFDTASLELGPPARWSSYVPAGMAPTVREGAGAFYDALVDRALVIGGISASGSSAGARLSDAWSIDWNREDRTPPPWIVGGPAFTLLGVGPNPSRGDVHITFALPRPTEVRTRLYDVRGRQVRDLGRTTYPQGPHVLTWDGRGGGGDRLRDGVYFARIEVEGKAYTGKLVLMD